MSVTQITHLVQGGLAKAGGWYVEGDASFTRTLTIGQILKARILRHYEGGRYLAEINGQQKVVDSTIPLRVGELVHGRVAALDDRVHLQRVASGDGTQEAEKAIKQPGIAGSGEWLDQLFARYQASLNPGDRAALMRRVSAVSQPQLMALAGLVLSKLGTPITAEFLNGLYRVLNTSKLRELVENLHSPNRLTTAETVHAQAGSDEAVEQLAGLIESARLDAWRRSGELPLQEKGSDPAAYPGDFAAASMLSDDSREEGGRQRRNDAYQEWSLGQHLLNTQSEGSVSHRLSHFPLWFGDRLLEISVALFSQQEQSLDLNGIRHRRLVLSLETASLGQLEITVNLADRHLRLHMVTGDEVATERLARHVGELKTQLEGYGWEIDEIDYVTETEIEDGAAVRAVVEHHITQDSLSRLM
ncbi:flagellar hook-length control protein FliK [Candidatus Thiodiazotropha sp. CDECU1]|uniref:flagellar hook-length control protein FliK n=1 Tax=Candidatus Thiodiazotropha sp. CDECU1 TaxID=3065865 RepID=UPI0029306446|nr:flagellar hook-length control protein FliK [Candidatus Thiodiazotropha sp. CDECU1]